MRLCLCVVWPGVRAVCTCVHARGHGSRGTLDKGCFSLAWHRILSHLERSEQGPSTSPELGGRLQSGCAFPCLLQINLSGLSLDAVWN